MPDVKPNQPGYCTCGRVLFITSTGPGCLNAKCSRNVRGSLHDAKALRSDAKRPKKKKTEIKSMYGAEFL